MTNHRRTNRTQTTMSNQIDRNSATWLAIKQILNDRLCKLRIDNDSIGLTYEKTCFIRGAISEVRRMLEWDLDSQK